MSVANSSVISHPGFGTPSYRAYALGVLLVIYVFNAADRMLLSVLQEPIKLGLGLSDFQLGLLGGPAFVLLYTLCQLPIARLAERANRMTIIATGAALWSLATASCGLAHSFVQLAISRVFVGIGEAACVPPSHSAISDYFPSEKRATAFAVFGLGIPIGVTLAAVGGGLAAQHLDWRWAFFVLGIPGVLAAVVLKLTVKEPARAGGNHVDAPNFMATLRYLSAKRSLLHAVIAHALAGIFGFSFVQFTVSYFIRAFEVDIATASGVFGLIAGIGTAAGIFLGGFVTDRLSADHPRAVTWLPAVGCSLAVPILLLGYLQASLSMAFVFFLVGAVSAHMYITPSHIIGQSVSHPRMRATVSAIILTAGVVIGYGIGPPLAGAIADVVGGRYLLGTGLDLDACIGSTQPACVAASAYGLRVGSIILLVFLLWAAVHFWLSGKTYLEDKVS